MFVWHGLFDLSSYSTCHKYIDMDLPWRTNIQSSFRSFLFFLSPTHFLLTLLLFASLFHFIIAHCALFLATFSAIIDDTPAEHFLEFHGMRNAFVYLYVSWSSNLNFRMKIYLYAWLVLLFSSLRQIFIRISLCLPCLYIHSLFFLLLEKRFLIPTILGWCVVYHYFLCLPFSPIRQTFFPFFLSQCKKTFHFSVFTFFFGCHFSSHTITHSPIHTFVHASFL